MVKLSNLTEKGRLVPYDRWEIYVDALKTAEIMTGEKQSSGIIEKDLEYAVKKRIPNEKFGIFFSGGVDSTTIAYLCKKLTSDFICYTVGIEGSKDLHFSAQVSKKLGLRHVKKTLSLDELETIFETTAKVLGKELINIVNLGVGSVVIAAIELAKKDNITVFFSGLGSEEIFAGYHRHEQASSINEECWSGLKSMWSRDLLRDFAIAKYANAEFLTPFLDKQLIEDAMKIDGSLKIKGNIKKYILRVAAENLGLPHEFAFRPKIAAQYGSSFDKAISKIAKSKGFKLKKQYLDYLATRI